VLVQDIPIEINSTLNPTKTYNNYYGKVYEPIYKDLSDARSEENLGWRWILPIGLIEDSERWFFDLGPQVGVFQPRYGVVGYGVAGGKPQDWADESFCANVQTSSILGDRRFDGSARRLVSAPIVELNAISVSDSEVAAHRWAYNIGYAGGIWNHENDGTNLGVICLTADVADVLNPPIAQLNAIFPANPDVAAYRWARQQGYAAGVWNHENDGTHLGVIAIKSDVADVHSATIAQLNAIFPADPDVAAHRWAAQQGYAAGVWNHEDDGTYRGVICFRP